MIFVKSIFKINWYALGTCTNKNYRFSVRILIWILAGFVFNTGTLVRSQTLSWNQTLNLGSIDKAGLERLDSVDYQYDIIGLGGTTLRIGPYGFTSESAPAVFSPNGCQYHPYLAYQYWWDTLSHRQEPFGIFGGYMMISHNIEVPVNGIITSFNHHLDINTGMLSINLGLNVGGKTFISQRTEFVTPAGVWIIRVADDSMAAQPFVLQISPTIDMVDSISYSFSVATKSNGMVITASALNACTSALAVAWDGNVVIDTTAGYAVRGKTANDTVTFYIAPASSYNPNTISPGDNAWNLANTAKTYGYANELLATQGWWNVYWGFHQVNLPCFENILAKWYARSLYYHGVFFGNTDIPTGIWGNSAFPGGGAICPEYDLVFSQLAMLYTNHIAESANIVNWIKSTLPQAEKNALSTNIDNVSFRHTWGSYYGFWVGYNNKIMNMGNTAAELSAEEAALYEDFPSANCALMAVKHADFTLDPAYKGFADTVLNQTTKIQVDDQSWNGSNYINTKSPSSMNQDGCIFDLSELVSRELADSAWIAMLPHVLMPTGLWTNSQGRRYPVLVGSAGGTASPASGDAPQLDALWWYGIIKKSDALVQPSFQLISMSNTAAYTFNRGTMSVVASKLYTSADAYKWALSLTSSDVTYDDATISEMVHDAYDFQRTPETAAHGALVCSVIQMLVDPDNNDPVEVFPAIPNSWWTSGVSFTNILVKGGILVSGKIIGNEITISLANINSVSTITALRVWLPPGTTSLSQSPYGTVVANNYATLSDTIAGNSSKDYNFFLSTTWVKGNSTQTSLKFGLSQNYPNPFNPTTQINYSIPQTSIVTLKIYNLLGQEVATLVNREQKSGNYIVSFDASKLASGVYIYKIQAGDLSLTKKMTFLK